MPLIWVELGLLHLQANTLLIELAPFTALFILFYFYCFVRLPLGESPCGGTAGKGVVAWAGDHVALLVALWLATWGTYRT